MAISDEIAPKKKEGTEIIYDMDVAISYGVDFLQNSRKRMDVLIDESGPSLIIKYNVYKDNYIKARSRGVKIRFVTEITKENVSYCKELGNIVDELKHLGGLKGSISVNESEFLGSTTWSEKRAFKPCHI